MSPSHTTSLALSLALREAGYKQENSVFVHIKTKHARGIYYVTDAIRPLLAMPDTEWCAAPLASEILDELGSGYLAGEVSLDDEEGGAFAGYFSLPEFEVWNDRTTRADTIPNALAKLWLHIHSQKII